MTVLLTRLSGTYLKAGVTERQEGLPLFMITLALHIIKTNPFTCLHFLQATCLVHTLKRSGCFAPTRFNQYIRIGVGGGDASPNSISSFTYLKHSAILKGLGNTGHNGVSK